MAETCPRCKEREANSVYEHMPIPWRMYLRKERGWQGESGAPVLILCDECFWELQRMTDLQDAGELTEEVLRDWPLEMVEERNMFDYIDIDEDH